MRRNLIWISALLLGSLGVSQARADGDIYSWEDAQGNYHFVDSLTQVPKKYRAAAKARADSGGMAGDGKGGNVNFIATPSAPGAPADADTAGAISGAAGDATGGAAGAPADGAAAKAGADKDKEKDKTGKPKEVVKDKAYFQTALQEWRGKKAQAQADLTALDADVMKARTTNPTGFQQALQDLESKRISIQAQIDEADRMLLEGIPAEARKVGAPPGWLR